MEEVPELAGCRAELAEGQRRLDRVKHEIVEAKRGLKAFRLEAEKEKEAAFRATADASDRRSTRLGKDASLHAALSEAERKLKVSEDEKKKSMWRESSDMRLVAREKEATSTLLKMEENTKTNEYMHESMLRDTLRQLDEERRHKEKLSRLLGKTDAREEELRADITKLQTKVDGRDKTIKELRAVRRKVYDRDRAQPRDDLLKRSIELSSLRSVEARLGVAQPRSETPGSSGGSTPAGSGRTTPVLPGSGRTTPVTSYNKEGVDPRRQTKAVEHLSAAIDCQPDIQVLARALEETGKVDELMGTAPFWRRRMVQCQALVDTCNAKWDVNLSARIKQDWLNSDRHLDGMRLMFSHYIPERMPEEDAPRPRPRHSILLKNPHAAVRGEKEVVFFPEPIKPRAGEAGWSTVIEQQNTDFGLEVNKLHPNCTQRNFGAVLQETVTRDAALLSDVESLDVVIGLDGFDSYCHVLLRLVDYKEGTAKESELKGAGLAVAVGDDHNPNLDLIFGDGLGTEINAAIANGTTVQLRGKAVAVNIVGCFDLSAARSVKARRSNASPWSNKLVPELIIEAPRDADMDTIEELILREMPLLGAGGEEEEAKLSHMAPSFPWSCSRCSYTVQSQTEENDNIDEMKEVRAMKSRKGRAAWAKRVKLHCEAHDEYMEYQRIILALGPLQNLVDLLHGIDINLPEKVMKFSYHDPVLLDSDPDLRVRIAAFYAVIGCSLDLQEKGDRDPKRKWFHGAVWHYDFVLGQNKLSLGLDLNVLVLALICYGSAVAGSDDMGSAGAVVDDLPAASGKRKRAAAPEPPPPDPLLAILRPLFGQNAVKVKSIFAAWTAYAEVASAHNEKWTSTTQEYRDERARRAYWAGDRQVMTDAS